MDQRPLRQLISVICGILQRQRFCVGCMLQPACSGTCSVSTLAFWQLKIQSSAVSSPLKSRT